MATLFPLLSPGVCGPDSSVFGPICGRQLYRLHCARHDSHQRPLPSANAPRPQKRTNGSVSRNKASHWYVTRGLSGSLVPFALLSGRGLGRVHMDTAPAKSFAVVKTHANKHINKQTRKQANTQHTQTQKHTHTNTHTHTQTLKHTNTQTHKHKHTHTQT